MILMAVLGAILIAIAISAHMTEVGVDATELYKYTSERENNYQMARSAVEMGYALLKSDTNGSDNLNEAWAAGSVSLVWEGKHVTVSVVDEESKFPLSAMQKNPDSCEYLQKALVRLFEYGGLQSGEEACDRFLDWTDPDSVRRAQGGEGPDYAANMLIKDGPLDCIKELLALPGWQERPHYVNHRAQQVLQSTVGGAAVASAGASSESGGEFSSEESELPNYSLSVPEAQTQGLSAESPWEDWVTVCSSGKININTAPLEVLRCLDADMTQTLVQEIDSHRRSSPFSRTDELNNVTGMDADLLFRIQDYLCVKSTYFSVDAEVLAAPGRVKLHTVVKRDGGTVKPVYWEIQ
ncbi:general secretion pathway protein GspK [bacterium]|nr:general secretion pathway protein GspK [bacterium]